jgi:hypothetical protein
MGYYVELRPRGTAPVSLEDYKARFAEWLEPHPGRTDSDPKEREKWADAFMHSGGCLSVYEWGKIPQGVQASARFSWGDSAASFRGQLRTLAELAERVSSDLYLDGTRIEPGAEEKIVADYTGFSQKITGMLGTVKAPKSELSESSRRLLEELLG